MSGAELVKKLLNGERDFRRIVLEERFNLEGYERKGELKNYLGDNCNDFKNKPILLDNSLLRGLRATRINIHHINGPNADFSEAYINSADFPSAHMPGANFYGANLNGTFFAGSNLENAVFSEASLHHVNFYRANLKNSRMVHANLLGAVLNKADLEGADVNSASFNSTSLLDTKIEKTIGLYSAHFLNTYVTEKEKEIIERTFEYRKMFTLCKG